MILNITRKSRNFHVFTPAYLAHAQANCPAASLVKIPFACVSLKSEYQNKTVHVFRSVMSPK